MKRVLIAAAAVSLLSPFAIGGAALADSDDFYKKQWEKRADCEKKLYEAKGPREFRKKAAECNRELAKLSFEQRKEAAKAWREAEKKWRERQKDYYQPYYRWDDD